MHEGGQFAIFLLAVTVFLSQNWGPSNALRNQDYLADIGDNVTLTCTIDINQPANWIKDEKQTLTIDNTVIIRDSRFRASTNKILSFSLLHISSITKEDAGIYECQQTQSQSGTNNNITGRSTLGIRFAPIIFNNVSSELSTLGEDIQLFCNATGLPIPNITWRRVNRSVPRLDDIVFIGWRLNISNVQKEDRGIYACEADNGVGQSARWDVLLNVEFTPEIILAKPEVAQAVNYSTELLCHFEAFPMPDIRWLNAEDEEIVNDTHFVITVFTSREDHAITLTHLKFPAVNRSDFGNYTCRADNKLGHASSSVTLSESPFPVLPLIKDEQQSPKDDENRFRISGFNVTGFILGMMPPLWISFYIILHLGFRSRYAEERPEEEGGDGLDEIVWEQGLRLNKF